MTSKDKDQTIETMEKRFTDNFCVEFSGGLLALDDDARPDDLLSFIHSEQSILIKEFLEELYKLPTFDSGEHINDEVNRLIAKWKTKLEGEDDALSKTH